RRPSVGAAARSVSALPVRVNGFFWSPRRWVLPQFFTRAFLWARGPLQCRSQSPFCEFIVSAPEVKEVVDCEAMLRLMKSLVDSNPSAVAVIDGSGRIVLAN